MSRSIQHDIDAMLDGDAGDDAFEAVGRWIDGNTTHADIFVRQAMLHSTIREVFETKQVRFESSTGHRISGGSTVIRPLRLAMTSGLALAALIALVAFVAWMPRTSDVVESTSMGDSTTVAMVTDLKKATFTDSSLAMRLGGHLTAGPLRLTSGSAQIMFASTAVVDLTGPCEFEMTGPNRGRLTAGRLEAFVPEAARGLTIDLPDGSRVVDLGTTFEVEVDIRGQSRLWVTEGRVELITPAGDRPFELAAGTAARLGADQRVELFTSRAAEPLDDPTAGRLLARMDPTRHPIKAGWQWLNSSAGRITKDGVSSRDQHQMVMMSYGGVKPYDDDAPRRWDDLHARGTIFSQTELQTSGFVGLLLRVQPDASSQSGFYMARLIDRGRMLRIERGIEAISEPVMLARPYQPGERWQLIFQAVGRQLTARVIDENGRQVAEVQTTDDAYPAGTVGLRLSASWTLADLDVYDARTTALNADSKPSNRSIETQTQRRNSP